MEGITRLVSESLARHGFDRPLDYRRLHWSRWFRCESHHSLLSVPSKPGVFALAEEVMDLGSATVRGRADAAIRPAASTVKSEMDGSTAQNRMLAVSQFFEDDDMAFVLDRMLSRENPMRARLASGRYFVRYVVIEDESPAPLHLRRAESMDRELRRKSLRHRRPLRLLGPISHSSPCGSSDSPTTDARVGTDASVRPANEASSLGTGLGVPAAPRRPRIWTPEPPPTFTVPTPCPPASKSEAELVGRDFSLDGFWVAQRFSAAVKTGQPRSGARLQPTAQAVGKQNKGRIRPRRGERHALDKQSNAQNRNPAAPDSPVPLARTPESAQRELESNQRRPPMPEVKTHETKPETTAAPSIPAVANVIAKKKAPGLSFRRLFTKPGVSPYDEIEWELRLAQITDAQGNVIFEQKDVEVPKDWSMTATNIVASKYLHGKIGTPERETGVRQLVARVAETIRDWGLAQGYFKTPEDGATFHDELVHILVRQYAAFNSPVWFNVGCDRIEPNSDARNWHWNPQTQQVEFGVTGYTKPQCSACFINSVKDSLDSILTLAKTEGMLFKWGIGTGTNLSSAARIDRTLSAAAAPPAARSAS